MDDILVPGAAVGMDIDFMEQNPEAIFDLITIKSLQDRYGSIESSRGPVGRHVRKHETEAVYQNETEFETFVQQFPIDDSIAACFATENGNVSSSTENKFVSGGKRPQVSTNFSKLKKKFGWKSVEETSLLSEDEIKSRDSKRSKKGGGVFSKRHKWRNLNGNNSKKSVNFSDQSEKSESETAAGTDDAVPNLSRDQRHSTESDDVFRTDSCSWSDSQITSFSEMFPQEMDQTVPVNAERMSSKIAVTNRMTPNASDMRSDSAINTGDDFADLLSGTSTEIIQRIEGLPPNDVIKLRDHHGNNLLHRSVLLGNADVIKYILENFPEMASEMNQENDTAVEIAAKYGKYECLKVILERNQRRKSLGVSLVNRLLNISAQHGQAECLGLILSYMSRGQQSTCALPGDTRGNTAAHLAAKHGHVHCLQALVTAGYDVTSENMMQQRPLHVAHQSRSHACFEYLLLLNICEELLSSLQTQALINQRLSEQASSLKPSVEHIRSCVKRYGDLCSETNQLLTENKISIMQTLNTLQEDLKMFVQHTSMDSATKRKEAREKLEELNGEIERLEDTFEFSPLSEMDGALTKLLSSLDEATNQNCDVILNGSIEMRDETSAVLSSLIRDIHKECMLENWDTGNVYTKHLGHCVSSPAKNGNATFKHYNHREFHPLSNMRNENKHITDMVGSREKLRTDEHESHKTAGNTQTGFQNSQDFKRDSSKNTLDVKDDILESMRHELIVPLRDVTNQNKVVIPHTDVVSQCSYASKTSTEDDTVVTNRRSPLNFEMTSVTHRQNNSTEGDGGSKGVDNDDISDIIKNHENPTERPFTKLLSLDERIDMLIAGEKEREKISDAELVTSSSESRESNRDVIDSTGSLYTSTFTSITSGTSGHSDWCSKLGLTSLETTSSDDVTNDVTTSTASYWWDAGDGRQNLENDYDYKVSMPYGNDIKRKIHLNLENDGSSYDELREHRLKSHLRSMQQTRYSSDHYRERITTSTGEIMGGFESSRQDDRVVVNVIGALKGRKASKPMPKPRKRGKPRLFTLEDAIATKPLSDSDFRERYDRTRSTGPPGHLSMRWEDMSITDEDEENITWGNYARGHAVSGNYDTDTTSSSHTPQSYV